MGGRHASRRVIHIHGRANRGRETNSGAPRAKTLVCCGIRYRTSNDPLPDPDLSPTGTRRLRRLVLLALPFALAAAVMWGRSYLRRDALVWENDRGQNRRLTCRLVSGGGRITFVTYSCPAPAGRGARPLAFVTGDFDATDAMAHDVATQTQQAGVLDTNVLGLGYSQHIGAMTSGQHVWTAAVVPWWVISAMVLAAPVVNWLFPSRSRRRRRRWRRSRRDFPF